MWYTDKQGEFIMKHIIFICDGENGNVRKPLMDSFYENGISGICAPELETGTEKLLTAFGFSLENCEKCAAPFIAASEGINLAPDDSAAELRFLSKDKISFGEAEMLADGLNEYSGFGANEFYACDGENCLLVMRQNAEMPDENECSAAVRNNPINERRRKRGLGIVEGCQIKDKSAKTYLPDYYTYTGKRCALTANNSIARGIARLANIELYDSDAPEEDFLAKAQAALNAFDDGFDAAFVHFNFSKDMIQNADTALTFIVNGLRARGEDYGALIMFDSDYIMYYPQFGNKLNEDIPRSVGVKFFFTLGEQYGK